jgi:hypothetical protein
VFIVMLPLPPKGVALALGAATWLVRTAQVGPLRLVMLGAFVDVSPMIKPAQTMTAPMTLMINALVPMVAPMFSLPPDVRRDVDTWRSALAHTVKCRITLRALTGIPPNR